MQRLLSFATFLAAVAAQSTVWSAISVGNITALPSPDGFNLTIDSATGLEWLDPTVTTNVSYNSMVSLLGAGPYTGFRHATRAEVGVFFSDLGLPVSNFSGETSLSDGGASYEAAAAYFGTTATSPFRFTRGITADAFPTVSAHFAAEAVHIPPPFGTITRTTASFGFQDDVATPINGHWLVRESPANAAVPEPMSAVVWTMLGTIAACGYGWRRRR